MQVLCCIFFPRFLSYALYYNYGHCCARLTNSIIYCILPLQGYNSSEIKTAIDLPWHFFNLQVSYTARYTLQVFLQSLKAADNICQPPACGGNLHLN